MTIIAITGANRGLGLALTELYAARGDHVIATARDPSKATALQALAKGTGRVEIHQLEVSDEAQAKQLGAALSGRAIDIAICNAGMMSSRGGIKDAGHDAAEWTKVLATNVTGVWLTARTLLPGLEKAKGAKLALLSSMMGSSSTANGAAYGYRASKAAVANLGLNLSVELRPLGIAVGIYHPGWVQTDMGGAAAPVTIADSAKGLAQRIDHLSLATTGVFEDYQGTPYVF